MKKMNNNELRVVEAGSGWLEGWTLGKNNEFGINLFASGENKGLWIGLTAMMIGEINLDGYLLPIPMLSGQWLKIGKYFAKGWGFNNFVK